MKEFSFKVTRPSGRVVETPDEEGWVSQGNVLTSQGIVYAHSNTYDKNGHTVLHFMHAGRLHVRSFDKYYRPGYLVTLAGRFAAAIAAS